MLGSGFWASTDKREISKPLTFPNSNRTITAAVRPCYRVFQLTRRIGPHLLRPVVVILKRRASTTVYQGAVYQGATGLLHLSPSLTASMCALNAQLHLLGSIMTQSPGSLVLQISPSSLGTDLTATVADP